MEIETQKKDPNGQYVLLCFGQPIYVEITFKVQV